VNLFVHVRFLMLLALLICPIESRCEDSWRDIKRIVAVGDIHGDYDQMFSVLQMSGIIDAKGRWKAGRTHLVQTGDIPDRGPDTARIIRFLKKLEKQAKRKKGFVHLLIGNHEAMNMIGDLRYVHPGEYGVLTSSRSTRLRDEYYKATIEWMQKTLLPEALPVFDEAYREKWDTRFPLGFVEHRRIWDKHGEFGKWVLDHNSIIKINDVLFVHGGIGPAYADRQIGELNREIVDTLSLPVVPGSIVENVESPLWYRGLARNNTEAEQAHLDNLLRHFDVNRVVIAHTVTEGAIKPRFDGKVIMIDTGMAAHYGSHKASLVIDGGDYSVYHRDTQFDLPFGGDELIGYLENAMALEPDKRRLEALVKQLKTGEAPDLEAGFTETINAN
jgi:hypothetical protein